MVTQKRMTNEQVRLEVDRLKLATQVAANQALYRLFETLPRIAAFFLISMICLALGMQIAQSNFYTGAVFCLLAIIMAGATAWGCKDERKQVKAYWALATENQKQIEAVLAAPRTSDWDLI